MDTNELLDTLNDKQKEAVLATEGPVLILAGAGSGKTRVLVHRIAYMIEEKGVNPGSILAVTFTNKAADEMRSRVDALVGFGSRQIWVSTFHSLCVRILRANADKLGYTRSFTIYDTDDQLSTMKRIFKEKNVDTRSMKEKAVLRKISSSKDELVTPEKYAALNKDYRGSQYADLYKAYQTTLLENNAMDFDDLIMKTVELFEKTPDVLAWYQTRFQYMMVDEYQDTNTAQFRLISLLTGTHRNLCVVGDDDQSIYRFRGANIHNILNFEKIFPDAHVVYLEQNYRSTQNILNAANEVIAHNRGRKEKRLWTENAEGGKIRFFHFDNAFDEASHIAREIRGLVSSGKCDYKDCVVLYRTNAQSRLFEEKLLMENVPYKIVGGVNFYQRKEIKDLLAYLKTIDNGLDELAVRRIINVPKRGIGAATLAKVGEYAAAGGISFYEAACHAQDIPGLSKAAANKLDRFTNTIGVFKTKEENENLSVSQLLEDVIETTGYVEELRANHDEESDARIENIDELINKAAQYEEDEENPSLGGFLEQVALIADIDSVDDDDNKVLLMTLHAAKGLEFPRVYMAGMDEGLFPSAMAINSDFGGEELEEERRLAYVGMTRARESLTLTGASSRMVRGEYQYFPISRFVKEIPRRLIATASDDAAESYANKKDYKAEIARKGGLDPDLMAVLSGGKSMGGADSFSRDKSFGQGRSFYGRDSFDGDGSSSSGRSAFSAGSASEAHKPCTGYAGRPAYTNPYKSSSGAAKLQKTLPDYKVGDMVRHVKFGEGIVKSITDGGRDYEVTVDFPSWGTKKMFASFAKLQKV